MVRIHAPSGKELPPPGTARLSLGTGAPRPTPAHSSRRRCDCMRRVARWCQIYARHSSAPGMSSFPWDTGLLTRPLHPPPPSPAPLNFRCRLLFSFLPETVAAGRCAMPKRGARKLEGEERVPETAGQAARLKPKEPDSVHSDTSCTSTNVPGDTADSPRLLTQDDEVSAENLLLQVAAGLACSCACYSISSSCA